MEDKILCQTDGKCFFIGTTVHNWDGAIDTDEPVYDKKTEKAKWDGSKWIIKSIIEWELKDGELFVNGEIITVQRPSEIYEWNGEEWIKSDRLILAKKQEINDRTFNEICKVYPLWKQNNIQVDFALYGDKTDLEKMNLFILQARAESDNEFYEVIK